MRFLRYLCFYCAARLIYGGLRSAVRRPAAPVKPCAKHGRGLLLTLALLPFVGCVFLILLGYLLRP
jgi:hypothetical protein